MLWNLPNTEDNYRDWYLGDYEPISFVFCLVSDIGSIVSADCVTH